MPDTPLERPDTTPTTPGQPAPGAWETLVRLWNMLKALIGDVGKLDDKVDSGFGDLNDKVDSGLEDLDGKINSTNDSLKDALDKITSQGGSLTELTLLVGSLVLPGTVWHIWCSLGGSDGKRPVPPGSSKADEHWVLCDGSNGTPDLRGRVILGAGGTYAKGDKGGSATHSHAVNGSVSPTTLNESTAPYHSHSMIGTSLADGDDRQFTGLQGDTHNMNPTTNAVGGSSGHSHTLAVSSASASSLPPYLALYPFMRLPG